MGLLLMACGKDDDPKPTEHEAVDLGLSVKWASTNVGAAEVWATGGLYGWADSAGSHTSLSGIDIEYHDLEGYVKVEWNCEYYGGPSPMTNISGKACDVATYKWGSDWRTPTLTEMQELLDKCKWEMTSVGATTVWKVTGPSGKFIYLPLAGDRTDGMTPSGQGVRGAYWTANLLSKSAQEAKGYRSDVACAAYTLRGSSNGVPSITTDLRCYGLSLRAVTSK